MIGFDSVCDFCLAATEEEYPDPDLRLVASTAKEIGSKLAPHRCRSPESCLCGCNWMDPETARLSNWGGWMPVLKCLLCGSDRVRVNPEAETGTCRACGGCWSGANFWRLLPPSRTPLEQKEPEPEKEHETGEGQQDEKLLVSKLQSLQFKPAKFDKTGRIYAVAPNQSDAAVKQFLKGKGGTYEDAQYSYRISGSGWINRFPRETDPKVGNQTKKEA